MLDFPFYEHLGEAEPAPVQACDNTCRGLAWQEPYGLCHWIQYTDYLCVYLYVIR